MTDQPQGPLAGIKVLDVTANLAGPAAAMHLADFGADVIKVERPDGGDADVPDRPPFPCAGLRRPDVRRNPR